MTSDESTLFVRGLGPSVTSGALEAHFSGIGPLRHAFVVTKQDDSAKCKGFGFVQFTNAEDAKEAESLLQGSVLSHRKVRLEIAKRRQRKGGRDGTGVRNDVDEDGGLSNPEKKNSAGSNGAWVKSLSRRRGNGSKPATGVTPWTGSLAMRTVVVRAGCSKPAGTVLAEAAVRRAIDADNPDFGFVSCVSTGNGTELRCVYTSWPLAGKAAARIHGVDFNACIDALRGGKRCRIIVRNLPFQVSVEEIRQAFSMPGSIRDINVPPPSSTRLPSSKKVVEHTVDGVPSLCGSAGYAFIEYFLAAHANHAISALNGIKVGGRVVAVDLAVSKAVYDSAGGPESVGIDQPRNVESEPENVSLLKSADATRRVMTADGYDRNELTNPVADGLGTVEGDDSVPLSDNVRAKNPQSSSEELSRTVFVRNLLFETSAPELKEVMGQFGHVEQAVLVVDQTSGRPRGSGFVRFAEESSADNAVRKGTGTTRAVSRSSLAHATHASDIMLGGRCLLVSRAVDRSKARQLVDETKGAESSKSDTRNLRLAWVGRVKPGTPEAAGLTDEDLRKRAHAEKEKRNKLAHNPNAYVSDVRLSVRNLPRDFDEKVLKHMCILASEIGRPEGRVRNKAAARITHVKIVRDEERKGRSKGYGFVQFQNHDDALVALEFLNNNPAAIDVIVAERPKALLVDDERARLFCKQWGSSRRLIVEFSVEDTRQVRIIDQVKQRGREKAAAIAVERRKKGDDINSDPAAGKKKLKTSAVTQKAGSKRRRERAGIGSSSEGRAHCQLAKRLKGGSSVSDDSLHADQKSVGGVEKICTVSDVPLSSVPGSKRDRKQRFVLRETDDSVDAAGSVKRRKNKYDSVVRTHGGRFEDLVEQYKRKLAATT
jgi:nucleolar protein 4